MKSQLFIQLCAFIGLAICGNGIAGDPCSSDNDCKTGFNIICVNSVCKGRAGPGAQCGSDNECLQGLVCGGNNAAIKTCAVPPSSTTTDPTPTPGSGTGVSGDACSSDSDCKTGFGLFCMNKICRAKMALGGQCEKDSDCLSGLVCGGTNAAIKTCAAPSSPGSGSPGSGSPGSPSTGNSGTGVAGSPCTSNGDCKTGFSLYCANSVCTAQKSIGSNCTDNTECKTGTCQAGVNSTQSTCTAGNSSDGLGFMPSLSLMTAAIFSLLFQM